MIPEKVTIKVYCDIKIKDIISDTYREYLNREFSDNEIKNKLEHQIRSDIWEIIPINKIEIEWD